VDLQDLTLESFAGLVGEPFSLQVAPEPLPLVLEEAEAVSGGDTREAFSLVFRGPFDPLLAQGIHPVEHADLGRLEIFLVPIGRDAAGALYQAIFA
jgi:hypothetical protein